MFGISSITLCDVIAQESVILVPTLKKYHFNRSAFLQTCSFLLVSLIIAVSVPLIAKWETGECKSFLFVLMSKTLIVTSMR